GRQGADVIVPLPPGSVISDAETGKIIRDFSGKQEEGNFIFLKGGNGGWGNIHFKSSTNQAPRRALPGQPGKTIQLKVELQIIADIGFVGFPNAGKSSLLDRFTNARPKIAAYPFTTKIPNLGVLAAGGAIDGADDSRDIILADIPGLIEGASGGAGLGIRFLKHISRTKALAFLIDLSAENFLSAYDVLQGELAAFSSELAQKKRILICTKTDLPETARNLSLLAAKYPGETVIGISVFSGEGLAELKNEFLRLTEAAEQEAKK
ncbi:MAG: 50S ribosome-binding GTPase, partial [Treponema sp.]|nr:50S ribosome-binding GTPase [Treponema sp.]